MVTRLECITINPHIKIAQQWQFHYSVGMSIPFFINIFFCRNRDLSLLIESCILSQIFVG